MYYIIIGLSKVSIATIEDCEGNVRRNNFQLVSSLEDALFPSILCEKGKNLTQVHLNKEIYYWEAFCHSKNSVVGTQRW